MPWQDIARRQHGVIAHHQLIAADVTPAQIMSMRRRGDLSPDPAHRTVWRVRGAPLTVLGSCWAAVLQTGGVLSHSTAAWLWNMMPAPQPGSPTHITMDGRRLLRPISGVRMHRVPLRPDEATVRGDLPITTVERTAIDCVRVLRPRQATALLDRALQQKWVSLADLDLEVARTSGRHGTPQLRRLRDACAEGDAESERLLHRILRQAGISGWSANTPVDVGFAVLTFDVVFPSLRLIVEVDGFSTHTEVERFTSDRTRQNAIEVRGWRILRFTWDHVANQPDYVTTSIREMIAHILQT